MTKLHTLIHELISILRTDAQGLGTPTKLGIPTLKMLSTASRVLHRLPERIINIATLDRYSMSIDIIWDDGEAEPLRYIECRDDGTIRFCKTDPGTLVREQMWSGEIDDFFSNHHYLLEE